MSATVTNNNHRILPPNVTGRSRGSLNLHINELRWTTGTSIAAKNLVGVQAKIIWWGESFQSGAILIIDTRTKASTKALRRTINYQIQTNAKLFHDYLRTCEPLQIKFTSSISNLQIGTAYVRLPKELIGFLRVAGTDAASISHKSTHQIVSGPKNIIGELVIVIDIYLTPNQTPRMVSPVLHEQATTPAVTSSCTTDDQKMPAKLRSALFGNANTDRRDQITSSKAYDYLTGRTMSRTEEVEALFELRSTSPTDSFVEALSSSATSTRTADDIRKNIDSLRVRVVALELSKAGQRETSRPGETRALIIVECKLSPFLAKSNNPGFPIRFTGQYDMESHSKIKFNKDAIRSVRIPSNHSRGHHNKNAMTIQFVVWTREGGTNLAHLLGTATVQLNDVLAAPNFTYTKACPVTSTTAFIVLGTLQVQLTLGCRAAHFGAEFLDAVIGQKENVANNPFEDDGHNRLQPCRPACLNRCCCCCCCKRKSANPKVCHHENPDGSSGTPPTATPSTDQSTGSAGHTSTATTTTTRSSDIAALSTKENLGSNCLGTVDHHRHSSESKLLCGLLYIGSLFHLQKQSVPSDHIGHFIVCRGFWQEDATATAMCDSNNVFNFLEMFPVVCNAAFFERTQNQFLLLELWQKQPDNGERMIGTTNLPLHQFYVAFRDPKVMQHLSRVKLPVISIDGWSSVVSPLAMMPIAKVQVVLAIGTDEQLEYLKASRGLAQSYLSEQDILKNKIPVPAMPMHQPQQTSITNAETQTNFTSNDAPASSADATLVTRQTALSEMLNSFIDNLASRLPERTNHPQLVGPPKPIKQPAPLVQPEIGGGNVQIRRTSDLLDTLQRALMCPPAQPLQSYAPIDDSVSDDVIQAPPDFQSVPLDQLANGLTPQVPCAPPITEPHFAVLIEIENAVNISKIFIRVNKKCGKQRGRCKAQTYRGLQEVEPSTYVTFDANGPPTSVVHSPDGPVYTTNVVAETSAPQWNKRFEVLLPVDLMINDEKRFILKVWRKASTDIPQARLLPNPIEDMIIGFTAIDLGVLLTGTTIISGWYNIIDFSGRINGQIKVNIQPKEDLGQYQRRHGHTDVASAAMQPLSVDVASVADSSGTVLSRTLKRKFTELEEISQRLRARLFDVTGDVNVDPDDEFENDLNTHPDEDDDDAMFTVHDGSSAAQFDWLSTVYGSAVFKAPSPVDFAVEDVTRSAFDDILNEALCGRGEKNAAATTSELVNDGEDVDENDDDLLEMYTKTVSSDLQQISCGHGVTEQQQLPHEGGDDKITTTDDVFDWDRWLHPSRHANAEPLPSTSSTDSTASTEHDRIRLISKALQKAVITDASAAVVTATATTSTIRAAPIERTSNNNTK